MLHIDPKNLKNGKFIPLLIVPTNEFNISVENSSVLLKDRGSSVYDVLQNKNPEEFYNLEIPLFHPEVLKS